jgi:hypothetical protein
MLTQFYRGREMPTCFREQPVETREARSHWQLGLNKDRPERGSLIEAGRVWQVFGIDGPLALPVWFC